MISLKKHVKLVTIFFYTLCSFLSFGICYIFQTTYIVFADFFSDKNIFYERLCLSGSRTVSQLVSDTHWTKCSL